MVMTVAPSCMGSAPQSITRHTPRERHEPSGSGTPPPSCQLQGALFISDESLLPHSFFRVGRTILHAEDGRPLS
jgi:hypothetical protein